MWGDSDGVGWGEAGLKAAKPLIHCDFKQALPSMVSAPDGVTVGPGRPRLAAAMRPHPRPSFPRSPWQPHRWPRGPEAEQGHLGKPAQPGGLPVALGRMTLVTWTGRPCPDPHQLTGHGSGKSPVLAGPQFPSSCNEHSASSSLPPQSCHVGQT